MRSTFSIRRPSAGFLVAIVALFVALGGTGYAAATLSGKDIARNSIPGNRIVRDGLGGGQIKESKLGVVPSAKTALSAQTAVSATTAASATTAETAKSAERAQTAQSAVDAQSAVNAQSAQDALKLQGRDATAFLASSVRVTANAITIADGRADTVSVSCSANEKGIGGGAAMLQGTGNPTEYDAQLQASYPLPGASGTNNITGWRATGRNDTGDGDRTLRVYAICVPKAA